MAKKIIVGIGIFTVLGVLYLIASGQIKAGEAYALIIVLIIFVLPGLARFLK